MSEIKDDKLRRVQDLFDGWAQSDRSERMAVGHEHSARQALEELDVSPGQHFLDIGCGNGYSVRWVAERHPSIEAVGLDASQQMVIKARGLSESLANTRFIHAPFPLVLLKSAAFDAILSVEAFYYLPKLNDALREVRRLLKPGGKFACVIDFYEENTESHGWPERVGLEMSLMSEDTWRAAFVLAGLKVVVHRRVLAPTVPGVEPGWPQLEGSL